MCVLWQLGHWEGMRPYDLEWGHLMGSRRAENVESLSHSKLPLVEAGYPLHLRRLAFSSSKIVMTLLGEVAFQVDASCPQDPLQSLLVVTRSIIRETSTKSDTGGHSSTAKELQGYCWTCKRCELLLLTASSFIFLVWPLKKAEESWRMTTDDYTLDSNFACSFRWGVYVLEQVNTLLGTWFPILTQKMFFFSL